MASLRIGYFLEDRAQEGFVKAIVQRVASENGIRSDNVEHDVRSSAGGRGKVVAQFRQFLRQHAREVADPFDLLIVSIDGNCKGFNTMETALRAYVVRTRYPRADDIVYAIPDPHIERWYLDDPQAFMRAIGATSYPLVPKYKCARDIYKQAMESNLRSAGISSLIGGAEYGELIASYMQDFYRLGKLDPSFGHFIDILTGHFIRLKDQ